MGTVRLQKLSLMGMQDFLDASIHYIDILEQFLVGFLDEFIVGASIREQLTLATLGRGNGWSFYHVLWREETDLAGDIDCQKSTISLLCHRQQIYKQQLIIMDNTTEDLQLRVKHIFQKNPTISLTISQQQNQSVTLYREDYQSLLPYRWLRTQAVDALIKILLQRHLTDLRKAFAAKKQIEGDGHRGYLRVMDAFVVTLIMTNQEDFILESLQPLSIFDLSTKYLLIPLNTENASGSHWLLGLLIQKEGRYKLKIFNSGPGGEIGKELSRRLQRLYSVLKKEEMDIAVSDAQNLLYQSNGFDCGVYTVGYSEYIMKQVVNEIEQGKSEMQLNSLSQQYKYLLCNSTSARNRYRMLIEEEIVKSMSDK